MQEHIYTKTKITLNSFNEIVIHVYAGISTLRLHRQNGKRLRIFFKKILWHKSHDVITRQYRKRLLRELCIIEYWLNYLTNSRKWMEPWCQTRTFVSSVSPHMRAEYFALQYTTTVRPSFRIQWPQGTSSYVTSAMLRCWRWRQSARAEGHRRN